MRGSASICNYKENGAQARTGPERRRIKTYMICEALRRRTGPAPSSCSSLPAWPLQPNGFTLIELLVVVAVIGILAGILLPALAKAKERGQRMTCLSNLKQVGLAIQMYADANEDTLPGPVWSGARAEYNKNTSQELIWFIAEDLGEPPPSSQSAVAEVFVCPGYRKHAPDLTSMAGRKCYLLNDDVDPAPSNRLPPFGYPVEPIFQPLKISSFDAYASPSATYAITDVDKGNINPTVGWSGDVPYEPVHGPVRNELYFDWHVDSKRW